MTSIPKELLIRECRFDLFCAIYYGLLSHALKYGACIKKLSWLFQDLYMASPNNLSNFAHNSLELDNGLELRNTNYSQYWLLSATNVTVGLADWFPLALTPQMFIYAHVIYPMFVLG